MSSRNPRGLLFKLTGAATLILYACSVSVSAAMDKTDGAPESLPSNDASASAAATSATSVPGSIPSNTPGDELLVAPAMEPTNRPPVDPAAVPSITPVTIPAITPATVPATTPASNVPLNGSTSVQTSPEYFAHVLEAITGNEPVQSTKDLLNGVVRFERLPNAIRLTKSDNEVVELGRDSELGSQLFASLESASVKAAKKFGEPVRELIEGISAISLDGNRVSILRTGPDLIQIRTKQKQDKKYWVKELRLSEPTFELSERHGKPAIANVHGVTVVLAAMSIPLEFRDFARKQNSDGRTIFVVGIKNPLPKQLAGLLGIEVIHLKFTEASTDKRIETDDSEMDNQGMELGD